MEKEIIIRCRAIILYKDKLLAVKHTEESKHLALPGGHLEWSEKILDSIKREIIEELGIEPKIGRLLYVNNLIKDGKQNFEFFFEITNAGDYFKAKDFIGTHRQELFDIVWLTKNDTRKLLPSKVQVDLNSGAILSDIVRFI